MPDPADETRELRRKLQQSQDEIERLCKSLLEIMDYIEARRDTGPMSGEINAESIWSIANDALDGGGDSS